MLGYISKKKGISFAQQKADEHRMINLIYRMRSKATHEMTGLGEESFGRSESDYKIMEPYYCNVGRTYIEDGKIVRDNIYELVIPNAFIRNILTDCIDSYLAECSKQCRFPFSHNQMTRKHLLSWYDK